MNRKLWISTLFSLGLLPALTACTETEEGEGGEGSAEATHFTLTVENITAPHPYFSSGVFNTPEGSSEPGPLLSGGVYTVDFHAPPGTRLSFATMFVPSNDLFLAPAGQGIALFDEQGAPLSGDISDQIEIWDAGTELDEELGLGEDQAPSQSGSNVGADDPNGIVRLAGESHPNLPAIDALVAVSLVAGEGNAFTLRIENLSDDQTLVHSDATTGPVPLAPGVFVVHGEPNPLFTVGESERSPGLEALAEDGDPAELGQHLAGQSGIVSLLAPGMWLVHPEGEVLFVEGEADLGLGLEPLAEDGDPSALQASYEEHNSGVFGGVYGDDVGPLGPAQAFVLEFDVLEGERLSFVSMFAQSNDIFLSTPAEGLALFASDGTPVAADISAQLQLWDAGTEINEVPGAGPNQAPRQHNPNSGADEEGVVHLVDDGFVYPAPSELVRITLTPTPTRP